MACHVCKAKAQLSQIKIGSYHYTESGLDNVFLMNVPGLKCEECKTVLPDVRYPLQLHQVVADALVAKPFLLTGREIRFLRTQLGYSQANFAENIHRHPSVLNRVEREKEAVSEDLDRVVRMMYLKEKATPKRVYDAIDDLICHKEAGRESYRLVSRKRRWDLTYPAAA